MNITNIDDIRKLASGDEGGRTEYKLITGQLERGMETLCAFLNGEGGTVLFGVADNGKITGQEVSDKTKREIAEAIRLFEPFATITVSYANIPDTDKQVIALYAEEQRYMRPFTYKGRAYQRIESVTSVMPQDKYNHLLMQRGGATSTRMSSSVRYAPESTADACRKPPFAKKYPPSLKNSTCCMTGS